MAEIVRIKDRIARRPLRVAPKGANADVLLFTGVRYQKTVEPVIELESMRTGGLTAPVDMSASLHSSHEPPV